MNILWIKVGGLWPLHTGGRLRSFHLIRELSRRHDVMLMTTAGPADDPAGLAAELPACRVVSCAHELAKRTSVRFPLTVARSWLSRLPVDLWKCRVPSLRTAVARRLATGAFDLVVADFLAAIPNVRLGGSVPVVLFEHNVEHLIWQRLSDHEPRYWRRLLLEVEWRKMRRVEAAACRRADLTLTVSDVDSRALQRLAPEATIRAVPTGVDVDYFTPPDAPSLDHALVFTGSLDWYPNEDAVLFFIDDILPRIRRSVPDVHMTVVGRNPTARLRSAAARAGIEVTGTVADVRPYVRRAAVSVVPLRVGSGTRLKIFEALAMGQPVVSTAVGAEGLSLHSGEHFVEANTPAAFADAVVALLGDPTRRAALGRTARQFVTARYGWPQVARHFESHCATVVERHTAAAALRLRTTLARRPTSA